MVHSGQIAILGMYLIEKPVFVILKVYNVIMLHFNINGNVLDDLAIILNDNKDHIDLLFYGKLFMWLDALAGLG